MTSASGACPRVLRVTITRLSTYRVRGCSPATEVGTISPRSLYASTSKVAGLAAWVSCGLYSAANVGHLHLALPGGGLGADLGVAVVAPLPDGRDLVAEALVARAAAQQRLQVVARAGEQAGEERALGRQAHAVARGAEGARDRRDHADPDLAVQLAPALGDLARIVGADGLERPAQRD